MVEVMKESKSAEDLRERFLRSADFVLDELDQVLRGEAEFSCKSSITLGNYMKTIQVIVEKASDKQTLDSLSISNVTKALVEGKINAKTAQAFMNILKTQQDIEELPKLIEAMQALLDRQQNE
jgi:hypothetical protein